MRFCRSGRRTGFTLFEMLVTLSIAIAILAVLIPPMNRARTAARRIQCLNNFANVALALHNYQDLHGVFPPGSISRDVAPSDPSDVETGPGWAWGAMLLPFLDQGPLASRVDFDADPPGMTTVISSLLCGEDRANSSSAPVRSSVALPATNCIPVFGCGDLGNLPGAPTIPGMFYRNSRVSLDSIRDGLSTTLMIGERAAIPFPSSAGVAAIHSTWYAAIPESRIGGLLSRGDDRIEPAELVLGTAANGEQRSPFEAFNGFSSAHEQGIHFSRADGSAGLMSRTIDLNVFRAMAGRSEAIDGQGAGAQP